MLSSIRWGVEPDFVLSGLDQLASLLSPGEARSVDNFKARLADSASFGCV